MFNKATIKLTAIYTSVLMVISICFSVAVGVTTAQEMSRPFDQPRITFRYDENIEIFEGEFRARATQANSRIILALILINFGVLIFGAGLSFLLARWTLKPLEKAFARESQFVSDASHELKTPLAALRAENEVLLRDKSADKKSLREQIASNLEEVKKLQNLAETLLQLNQSQPVTDPKERAEIVEQIVKILVENAVKYDPKHRQPEIVRSEKEIKVIDQGSGIAEEDLPHIFERFYRAVKSRTTDGYGLGLALAQSLAEQIGAEIVAANNEGAGATFAVKL